MIILSDIFHNIGILAHVDAGKTTLTEQLLYITGAIRNPGSVDSGTTATDSLTIEKQRGISVRTASASTQWHKIKINIIDTPGHVDFAGEVERALAALDYAVVVISAADGIRAHTENILKSLDKAKLPAIIFINKIDREGADANAILTQLKTITNKEFLPFTNFTCNPLKVNKRDNKELIYSSTEILANINDEAADIYLNDELLSEEKSDELIKKEINSCKLIPVVCGSAKLSLGIKELADIMTDYMPSSKRRETNELCGIIYKIEHDKMLGKVSHIRLFGGELSNRDEVEINTVQSINCPAEDSVDFENEAPPKEKISQIKRFSGAKLIDSGKVQSGDIAAIYGLPSAKTGKFIGTPLNLNNAELVHPFLRVKVSPADNDIIKIPSLAAALKELSDEEPYIDAKWENGQQDITINTTGKIQLEVIENLLKERYGLSASFSPPAVIYKETPASMGTGGARYTMPKPCWAVVDFEIEPMPRGYGVTYHGKLPNNQCFYRYQSHIRTSFKTCIEQGLYGWEVTDFKCTLIGGEHHTIHTHPLDFFVCTPMAFMNTLEKLGTKILEPLLKIRISAPEEFSGKLLSEIIKMGGEYDTPVTHLQTATFEAIVPVATSMEFPTRLAVMTSGKGILNRSFYGYRECNDGLEHINPRRGVNPLDRSKWILWARGAFQTE